MTILYDIIFIVFAILYIPYLTIKGKWHKGFWMRLGFFPTSLVDTLTQKENIWVHAVSVGEVLAVLDLIKEIKEIFPEHRIVCSTVTKTGNDLAREKLSKEDLVVYAPLDLSFIVRKFIRTIQPKLYIAAETEIWPNLYYALNRLNVKIVQVNGRISDSAFRGYSKVGFMLKGVLKCVDAFCMQSNLDADRIIELGAVRTRVKVVGNVKFDISISDKKNDIEKYGFNKTNVVFIGGSTHPGEEEILLTAYKGLSERFPEFRMILAPRHIERSDEVLAAIEKFGFKTVRFSQMQDGKIDKGTILLVDTIGHLRSLYGISKIVFIGKSFCGIGGQNMIEPAYFGNAVIVGPHTENFKYATNMFLRQKAIIQLQEPQEVEKTLSSLLDDPKEIERVGALAKEVVLKNKGATEKTLGVIIEKLNK